MPRLWARIILKLGKKGSIEGFNRGNYKAHTFKTTPRANMVISQVSIDPNIQERQQQCHKKS
jgi:hypothetical protein